ncbi:MAG: hypothetical protein HUJ99_08215, partial [Bacteroidaceae bacterium]|nr:hypothetical protein [Bacteroidaceae bacterium]
MASKDVTFSVRITDEGSLKRVSVDAQEFKDVIKTVTNEVEGLKTKLINFTQFTDMVDQVSNSFLQFTGLVKNLTDTYAVQIEAETQLATTMRNNMDATDADIESIKRLCAAQQELGIIGDEVQLAGAQELATYLEHKSTLEKLIPVLNDMNAQQYGLNATTQSSVTIATMLGKVMEGQTGALSRYGYSFDAAQEQVLKFGTEEERVAVLVDVVTSAVGGMNAELARTDVGRQKQLDNIFGDIKEQLGGLISPAMNACTVINEIASAAAGITKLAKGFDYAIGFVKSLTASCKLLNVAMKATFITSGIGLAILAITEVISALSTSTEEATEQFQDLKQATDEYTNKAAEVRANINSEIESLGRLIASHGNEEDAVNRLNNTYGQVFGTYQTASDWYEILTQQSENYVKQVGYEAQARLLATKIAEKQIQLDSSKAEREKILANSNIKSNPSYWDIKYGNAVGLSSKDDKRYKELEKNEKDLT